METISLLWKEKPETRKQLHENVLDDMGISYLLNEIFPEKQQKYVKERMLEISMDVETIRYRQEIFRELFENPDFMERIAEALDKIKAYDASQRAHVTLDKKSGLLRKYLLGKNVDYCTRVVISASPYTQNDPADNMVTFNYSGVPIAQICSLCYPFVIAWLRNFFERELPSL